MLNKDITEQESQKNLNGIDSLPDELLVKIFRQGEFNAKELSKIAPTSRMFSRISSDNTFWKSELQDDFILSEHALNILRENAGNYKNSYLTLQNIYKGRLMSDFHLSENSAKRRKNEFGDYRSAYQACMNSINDTIEQIRNYLENNGYVIQPFFLKGHPWLHQDEYVATEYLKTIVDLVSNEGLLLTEAVEKVEGLTCEQAKLLRLGYQRDAIEALNEEECDILEEFHHDGITLDTLNDFESLKRPRVVTIATIKRKCTVSTIEAFEIYKELENIGNEHIELYLYLSQNFNVTKEQFCELDWSGGYHSIYYMAPILKYIFKRCPFDLEIVNLIHRSLSPDELDWVKKNIKNESIQDKLNEFAGQLTDQKEILKTLAIEAKLKEKLTKKLVKKIKLHGISINDLVQLFIDRLYYPENLFRGCKSSSAIDLLNEMGEYYYPHETLEDIVDVVVKLNEGQARLLRSQISRSRNPLYQIGTEQTIFHQTGARFDLIMQYAELLEQQGDHIHDFKTSTLLEDSLNIPEITSLESALDLSRELSTSQLRLYTNCYKKPWDYRGAWSTIPAQREDILSLETQHCTELHVKALATLSSYYNPEIDTVAEFFGRIIELSEEQLDRIIQTGLPLETLNNLNEWQYKAITEFKFTFEDLKTIENFDKQTYRFFAALTNGQYSSDDLLRDYSMLNPTSFGKFFIHFFSDVIYQCEEAQQFFEVSTANESNWFDSELHMLAYLTILMEKINGGEELLSAIANTFLELKEIQSMDEIVQLALAPIINNVNEDEVVMVTRPN